MRIEVWQFHPARRVGAMVLRLDDLVALERKFAVALRNLPGSSADNALARFRQKWTPVLSPDSRKNQGSESVWRFCQRQSVNVRGTPDSNIKCNTRGPQGIETRGPQGIGCCDGQTIQAPQRQARGVILAEHRRGASLRVIGLLLGRSATMIGRELRRGGLVRAAGERCEVTADPT